MSRILRLPLLDRILQLTGDILLRAELSFLLRDENKVWTEVLFRVDSGSEICSMPAARARHLALPMPIAPLPLSLNTSGGAQAVETRSGGVLAQVIGLEGTELWLPCFFLGNPAGPDPGPTVLNLLGLTGVVDKLRLIIDGTPEAGAPHGVLIVELLVAPTT
jgi:hypothetical protein